MIDFHSHILPDVDDGPDNVQDSLIMLQEAFRQGVDTFVSTSHFYSDEECPEEFLKRRDFAARELKQAMFYSPMVYPKVVLGAEVLYFPGISEADGIDLLRIENSRCILIEPPMAPWSEDMLDDIQQLRYNFDLIPIIAHVDRYMMMLRDDSLMNRVLQRKMLVQVNGSYFLNPKTKKAAFGDLKAGKIHVIGSDCHNMDSRPPNLPLVRRLARENWMEAEFQKLHRNAAVLLMDRRVQK